MKWPVFLIAVILAATASAGDLPEVDTSEVLRLGDVVQHVDGIRQDSQDLFVEAMGPPANDADKWFISILTMQGCAPCAKLKADWDTSPHLLALANPHDAKKSWSHFQTYSREDKSQAFRFEDIKVKSYPTVIVQPPRTGRWGDPKTVVYQGGYGGDPERLARQIVDAIRRYVTAMESAPRPADTAFRGADPPWDPAPRNPSIDPDAAVVFPDGLPLIPPPSPVATVVAGLSPAGLVVLSVIGTLVLVFVLPLAVGSVRKWQEERHRKAVLMESLMARLSELPPSGQPVNASSTAAGSGTSVKASPAG